MFYFHPLQVSILMFWILLLFLFEWIESLKYSYSKGHSYRTSLYLYWFNEYNIYIYMYMFKNWPRCSDSTICHIKGIFPESFPSNDLCILRWRVTKRPLHESRLDGFTKKLNESEISTWTFDFPCKLTRLLGLEVEKEFLFIQMLQNMAGIKKLNGIQLQFIWFIWWNRRWSEIRELIMQNDHIQ